MALLATRANAAVSTDALIDELWAGEPPDGAATTLRSYVSRLRSALGPAVSIERLTSGYVLGVDALAIDLARFERLSRDGHELQLRGRHRRAAATLAGALREWRGEAFAGLRLDGLLGAEAARLEELRVNVLEQRIEAELELGGSSDLIDEIESLVARHPFRERLWRHLMLALYRASRQADALAAYHRARRALDDELGIEPGPELQALEAAILRQDVPPLRSERARPMTAPPLPLTSFVGRARELDEIRTLLFRSRLVTLVGVGGVGKTRLATEAAARASADLVDAVAFVDLAAITNPELVAHEAIVALGVADEPGETPAAAVARDLEDSDVLLILDNCEHVRDAAAAIATDLLSASPGLRILATSRAVLDVAGEAAFPVQPLLLPLEDSAASLRESEAVRLLLDRATLQRHGLRIDEAAYDAAARIVRELDGLPLAIELAAARTKALSLDEIAVGIRDRFQFLVSWRRLASARHRTLREAMDWSFELLDADEQRLLQRMAVFPAGASMESIEAVCFDPADGDGELRIERLVERLVDASLVTPTEIAGGTRYRLLETVRQYADERLPDVERTALHRRLAEHVRAIVSSTSLSLEGIHDGRSADLAASFQLATTELPSIRAALEWAARADPALGIDIAVALERFWATTLRAEGIAILTRLLEAHRVDDLARARALRCRGGTLYVDGSFEQAIPDYAAALAIHRRLQQRPYEAHLLMRLAVEAHRLGDGERARALLADAERIGGDDRFVPDAYVSITLAADLAFDEGRVDEALELLHRAGALAEDAGDGWWRADTLLRLADLALRSGRAAMAAPAARQALAWARSIGDRQSTLYGLAYLAWEAAASGDLDRAGRLWGGLQAEVERGGPVGQWELEEDDFRTHVSTDADVFRAGAAAGRSRSLDVVVEEALSPG